MASTEDRLTALERDLKQLQGVASAIQGQPASALISIPHNDSWLFEDNVDGAGGFGGNLRYIISGNVQRVVSARLSIHLAAYRTYSNFSVTNTGNASVGHTHASAAHAHTTFTHTGAVATPTANDFTTGDGAFTVRLTTDNPTGSPFLTDTVTPAATGGQSSSHNHTVAGSSFLGITEGVIASGLSLSFDGADHTADLGGPFNADVIELDVLRVLPVTKNAFHVISMLSSGLGRIEAHLRLGVYVSAGSVF